MLTTWVPLYAHVAFGQILPIKYSRYRHSYFITVRNIPDHEFLTVVLVYMLHPLVNDNGIQIGAGQHVLITHTVVFVAHFFALVQASKREQTTWGAQNDVLIEVSKL